MLSQRNNIFTFLRRNTSKCPRTVKSYCYQIYVRPTLECVSIIWNLITKQNIDTHGIGQRQATRYMHNVYNSTQWLAAPQLTECNDQQLNWHSLEPCRQQLGSLNPGSLWCIQVCTSLVDTPLHTHTASMSELTNIYWIVWTMVHANILMYSRNKFTFRLSMFNTLRRC